MICQSLPRTVSRLIACLLVAGLAVIIALWLPNAASAASDTRLVASPAGNGNDAPFVRYGLLGLMGLALCGGGVRQYRTSASAPPRQRVPRPTRRRATPTSAVPASGIVPTPATTPAPAPGPLWPTATSLHYLTPHPTTAPRQLPPPIHRTPAEEACACAVAAAHRYDRPNTIAHFSAALALDPQVRPASASRFWEMPSAGHADLARAYLQQASPLDARSVVTLALLTFPHNRELEQLLQEIAATRLPATA